MKIVGDSIQEGIPTPENPKEIKHEPKIVVHTIDGKEIMIPITEELELKEGDFIFKSQKNDKWYLRKEKQMNEEEAIERCEELLKIEHSNWIGITNQVAISILLNLIDKQNKVIDEMAKYMDYGRGMEEICNKKDCYVDEYINGHCQKCLNCIKQYFIRKVEENDNRTS